MSVPAVRIRGWMCLVIVLCLVPDSIGFAQTSQPQETSGESFSRELSKPLLAGPKVEPESMGRGSGQFGSRGSTASSPPIPLHIWMRTLERVPLTIEQRAEVSAIVGQHRRKWRDYVRSDRDEVTQLQQSIQRIRREGGQPPPEQVRRLQYLRARIPQLKQTQLRIWKLMTAKQQQLMRMELARNRIRDRSGSGS